MPVDTQTAARRFYSTLEEAVRTGNVARLDDVIAPDAVDHHPDPDMKPGREGIKEAFAGLGGVFPDLRFDIEDVLVQGDKAALRVIAHGTQRGPFLGFAPTNREISYTVIDILRFTPDGRLIERWGLVDEAAVRRQLATARHG